MSSEVLASMIAAGFGARKAPSVQPAVAEPPKASKTSMELFAERYPEEAAWIDSASARGFNFACDMVMCIKRFGKLTTGQLDAVRRGIAKSKDFEARRAAEAQAAQVAPEVTVARIEEAFAHAIADGIKRPKLRLDVFTFKPAPATGKNAGAIYVTAGADRDGQYLGKVMGGRFLKTSECTKDQEADIIAAASDPAAAAKAYGLRTGTCSVCGRELTDSESIDRGIGPVCSERFGWA